MSLRRWTLPPVALALALALAVAGGAATDSSTPAGGQELLILATASNRGEVEPCG